MLVRQKVEDYAAWKRIVDEHAPNRRASGSLGGTVYRNADDPTDTLILMTWDDLDRARLFVQSDDFREATARVSGLEDTELWFLHEADWLPD